MLTRFSSSGTIKGMNKILLVYEDYSELMNVEAALKKIGFDVIGITHEYSIMEQVISFNPDVVVGCGKGGKVSSLGVGRRLKEMGRWSGKTILIFAPNSKPAGPDLIKIRSDIMLEAPVPPLRLIQVLAKILGHDETVLQERLNKMIHGESAGSSGGGATTFSTAKNPVKNENVKFVVGGNSAPNNEKTLVGGMNFNRASESEESGGEDRGSTLFTHLKGRQDLYQNEVKGKVESGENLFAEVDLKSLERELAGDTPVAPAPKPEENAAPRTIVAKSSPSASAESLAIQTTEAAASSPGISSLEEEEKKKLMEELASGGLDGTSDSTADAKREEFWAAEKAADPLVVHQQEELAKAQASVHDRVARYSEYLKAAPVAAKGTATQLTRTEARKRQRELVKDWDAEKLKDLDKLRREFTKALYKK